jgi:hypothetical protein
MSDTPPPLPNSPNRSTGALLLGLFAGNLVGGALMAILLKLIGLYKENQISTAIAPNLFLVPLVSGLVSAWFWRRWYRTAAGTAVDALWSSIVAIVGGAILLREGVICLLMGIPIIYVMTFIGMLLGRWWFGHDSTTLRSLVLPGLVLFTIGDAFHRPVAPTQVTDRIVIHASRQSVWPHVLAFPRVSDQPDYWLFRIGLPYPEETTNGGNFVGADRSCIFSRGIVIREAVAEFEPNRRLTFDIVEQPGDPEIYGHITLHRGQFSLTDNNDGTTLLTGSSWYTLHVRPRWYFNLWARDMTRAVHLRVMKHVRRLAERQ